MAAAPRRRAAQSARRRKLLGQRFESLEPRRLLAGGPVISEFLARNEGPTVDQDGEPSDWIEIQNTSAAPLNLAGWHLTDKDDELDQWTFPSVTLAADASLLVFASGKDRAVTGSELHTNFKLDGDGEYLALVAPNAVTIEQEFAPEYPNQYDGISYGLASNLTTRGYFLLPTPNAPNTAPPIADPTRNVVISEIMYHPSSNNDLEEYIELANIGTGAVNLNGWQFTSGVSFTFPNVALAAGQRLVVARDVATFSAKYPLVANVVGGWDGQLSDGAEAITLKDLGGGTIDRVEYADEGDWALRTEGPLDFGHRGWEWQDEHDGLGRSLELVNAGLPNEFGLNWRASVVDQGTPGAANSVAETNSAPLILELTQLPIIPRSSDSVTITARLVDEQTVGLAADLHWRIDGAPSFTIIHMRDDGLSGDEAAGDGVFGATIPAQDDGVVIEYFVASSDAGARTRIYPTPASPTNEPLANRLYQVDDAFDPNAPWIPESQPVYRLIMTEAQRAELASIGRNEAGGSNSNAQMNGTFIVVDGTGVDARYNVGIRNRGHGSRNGPPNNYRVNLPKDRPWDDVSELNFNCRSIHSQLIGSAIYQFAGLVAADTTAAEVRVNGQDLSTAGMFGSYVLVEQLDSNGMEHHFPNDSEGNLYSAFRLDSGLDEADLDDDGPNPDAYRNRYFKETNEEDDDFSDLIALTEALNNAPAANYVQAVGQHVNIDQWLRYLALDALLQNRETGLNRGIGDDYSLYRGVIDPRFVLVPHDLDTLLGQGNNVGPIDQSIFTFTQVDGLARFLQHPEIVPRFYQQFVDLIETTFNPETLNPLFDQLLGPFVAQSNINAMKAFVVNRSAAVLAQIPQEFRIDTSLPVVSGFARTTSPSTSLSGVANALKTQSVLVDGRLADFNAITGEWATTGESTGDQSETLIAQGAVWRFRDNGSNQETAWRELDFDATTWSQGPAQLGYGDDDEATPVNGGPAGDRFITTYFRHEFNLTDPERFTGLVLRLLRDDGAVIHLNGEPIHRSNMPEEPEVIDFETLASQGVSGVAEDEFLTTLFSTEASLLREGKNVIAVEIHQFSPGSGDISFDLELLATRPGTGVGAVPLQPGVNRVLVEAFSGPDGTGQLVDSGFLDVWFDGQAVSNVIWPEAVRPSAIAMLTRGSYLPGIPMVVRIEALDAAGRPLRELWDATVELSTDTAAVTLSAYEVQLRNGVGSALVTPTGSGDFTLTAALGDRQFSKRLNSLAGAPVTTAAGALPGASTTWSGVVNVTADVTVPAGHTLTIQPGTLVLLAGNPTPLSTDGTDLIVAGTINALGTAAEPIAFTAADPTAPWGEIRHQSAQPSQYRYAQITRAGHAPRGGHTNTGPAIRTENSTIVFDHVDITDIAGKTMTGSGSNLTFTHSQFARSAMGPEVSQTGLVFEDGFIVDMLGIYREDGVTDDNDGIYIHRQAVGQTVRIARSLVAHTDDDGIDTLGPDMVMEDLIIRDLTNTNDDPKGITIINGNNTIRNVLMANVDIGISAKGQSGTAPVSNNTVDHVTIQANSIGIQAEDKFGIPGAIINYNIRNSVVSAPDPFKTDYPLAASTAIVINYTNLVGEAWAGTGNLNVDPRFVNPGIHDFQLQPGSPSVNAGDPTSAADPDGSRADQGYYLSGVAGQVAASQLVGGALSGNTILAPWRGQYLVTGDVTVPAGATLTVLPGTTVFFQAGTGITFNGGRLIAEGTAHELIRFTRVPGGGNWDGLQFANSMIDNRIAYAVLEYGVTPTNLGMIGLDNSSLTIDHATLDHADRRRIRSQNSSLIVRNSVFTDIFPGQNEAPTTDNLSEHIWGGGIPVGGQFILENNIFGRLKGHNDGIDFDAPRAPNPIPQILGNVFLGGGDDALDMTGDYYIEGNTFMHFHKDQYNLDPGQSNVLSSSGGDYTVVRNTFLDADHVAIVKENAFMNFIQNTVVDVDLPALYFDLAGQTSGPGRGARIVGSVFQNTATVFAETPTETAEIHQSIVPAAWLGFGDGNLSEDARLADPANGDFSLRSGSPAIGSGPNGLDRGAIVPRWASISGEPPVLTHATSASLTVGGPGIVQYQYRVNGGAWSAARDVSEKIELANLANGSYTVFVRGRNVAGGWQSPVALTASRTWTVNAALARVVINEVLASNIDALPHQGTRPDAIELFNAGAAAVNLAGMSISDDPLDPTKYVFPAMMLQPGAYLTLYADSAATPGLHLGFGLDADGDGVFLYSAGPARTLLDSVEFGAQVDDFSIARLGQAGVWGLAMPTLGAANLAARTGDSAELSINEWFASGDLLLADDFIELYNADPLPVPLAGLYLTDNYGSVPRKHQIAPLSFVAGLGAVAFIADGNESAGSSHLSFRLESLHETLALVGADGATLDRVAYVPQTTDVSQGRLPNGEVLFASFTLPTPGLDNSATSDARMLTLLAGLRISEIMYNPIGGPDYEYVELRNISAQPLDITGVRLGGGIEFVFPSMVLAPGAYVVAAGNAIAFQQRYGAIGNLAGVFDGNLDNSGEDLLLQLPETFDAAILRFDFDDAWYPATDSGGRALLIRDGVTSPHDWRLAESWSAGLSGGTPGRGEVAVPGDANGDGRVDLDDLNEVRNHFGEAGPNVPGDTNGDDVVDLADLNAVRNNFGIGAAPAPRTVDRRPITAIASRPSQARATLAVKAVDLLFGLTEAPPRPKLKAR